MLIYVIFDSIFPDVHTHNCGRRVVRVIRYIFQLTKKWRNPPTGIRLYHPLYLNSTRNQTCLGVLDEADVGGILPEAATAEVEAVLADDAVRVGAHAAATARAGLSTAGRKRSDNAPLRSHCLTLPRR